MTTSELSASRRALELLLDTAQPKIVDPAGCEECSEQYDDCDRAARLIARVIYAAEALVDYRKHAPELLDSTGDYVDALDAALKGKTS